MREMNTKRSIERRIFVSERKGGDCIQWVEKAAFHNPQTENILKFEPN